MADRTRAIYSCGCKEVFKLKFRRDFRVQQDAPEGRRLHQSKREDNTKDEDDSSNNPNNQSEIK